MRLLRPKKGNGRFRSVILKMTVICNIMLSSLYKVTDLSETRAHSYKLYYVQKRDVSIKIENCNGHFESIMKKLNQDFLISVEVFAERGSGCRACNSMVTHELEAI
jgi:hypothetical protein